MRKGILILILPVFFSFGSVYAGSNISINNFKGGKIDFRAAVNTDYIYGGRGDALRNGGTVSTLDWHMSFTSYNPACLAFMERAYISMPIIPVALGASADLVKELTGSGIEENVNGMLDSMAEGLTKAAGVEMKVQGIKGWVGQAPGITGIEFAMPFAANNAGFGISREEKTTVEIAAIISGAEMALEITDDNLPGFLMGASAALNAVLNAQSKNIVTSFGLGRKITPIWGIGFAVDKYESACMVNAVMEPVAYAVQGTTVEMFNTSEYNSLNAAAKGSLKSEAWGLRFGTALHSFEHNVETAVDFSIQPELKFTGGLDAYYHALPDEIDQLDMTKTIRKEGSLGEIRIKIPSFVRVVLAWKPGAVISMNYTHYFDALEINYEDTRAFLEMRDAFRLGFNFGGFQFGGGVMLARIGSETKDESGSLQSQYKWYPVPVFSTGFVIPFGKNLETELEFLAVPMPFLKGALTYNF